MCVTTAPAELGGTSAFTYATLNTTDPRTLHVSGYQNYATNKSSLPNCMLLHFPGDELEMVSGPERTRHFMEDLTQGLQELVYIPRFRSLGNEVVGSRSVKVQAYGDYHVVLAEHPGDILDALEQVPENRRPPRTGMLEDLVAWYRSSFSDYSFVLACFDGQVAPRHPIVVQYVPHNDDVLFVPGIDAHDGTLPRPGHPMQRDIKVAFASESHPQPQKVVYHDSFIHAPSTYWAPTDVAGFHDNRSDGPNQDYIVPLLSLDEGLNGADLVEELVS
jgi:hypothetical protein